MKHRREHELPHAHGGSLRLQRSAREGTWWQRGDGLSIRMAAPEHAPAVDRGRVSLLGVLLAWLASGPSGSEP